jgi:hypothetical protein
LEEKMTDKTKANAHSSHLSSEVAEDDIELELSQAVRLELFMSHACHGVYGDDGEMQCNVIPAIDFKRNFPSEILVKCAIHRLIRAKLAAPPVVNPDSSHLSPEVSEAAVEKCGKPAAPYIPRWGMSFACVLPVGHEGEHRQGGTCFAHGEYVGTECPEWPNCIEGIAKPLTERAAYPAVNPEPHPSPASPKWETACVGLDESDLIPSDEQAVRQVYPHAFKAASETIWNAPGWASNYAIGDSWADARSKLPASQPDQSAQSGEQEAATDELTFGEFQSMNMERCRRAFPMCADWTMNDWAVALAGEVGELCNLLKKDRRGLATDERYDLDGPYQELARGNVLSELADIITYADLMISKLSESTAEQVMTKFNEVSGRVGYSAAIPVAEVPLSATKEEKD